MPGGLKHVGKRRTIGRTAAMADMQRPGRIGRDELDLHLAAVADIGLAELRPLAQGRRHSHGFRGAGDEEIDETGARDFCLGDPGRLRQFRQQQAGDVTRIALERLGKLQREVAGKVAVARLPGPVERDLDRGVFGRYARQCGAQQF